MQGQKGVIVSLSEAIDFDHGSTSTNSNNQICWNNLQSPATTSSTPIDSQLFWNGTSSPAENQISNYGLLPNNLETSYDNLNHQRSNLCGWNLGETSSSNPQVEVNHNEQKAGVGWTPSATAGPQPSWEGRLYEPSNALSLDGINRNPLLMQTSSSSGASQNINLNAGFMVNDVIFGQGLGHCHSHKSNKLISERNPPNAGSGSLILPSGGIEFLVEGNDYRSGYSLEACRISGKRKAIEDMIGQSSVSGSSSHIQNTFNWVGPGVPTEAIAGNNLSMSGSQEHVNATLGLTVRDEVPDRPPESSGIGSFEASHRNVRMRINPSNQQDSLSTAVLSSRSARLSSGSSSRMSLRYLPVDQSPDMSSAEVVDNVVSQSESIVFQVPPLPRNSRWNRSSGIRTEQSSNSNLVLSRGSDTLQHVDVNSRSIMRNILEHPMFIPATDFQNLDKNPSVRTLNGVTRSIPGNVASPSQARSSLASHPTSTSWVSHSNPPRHPRRLTEYVPRSLFSSGSEIGIQGNNTSVSRLSATAVSQERVPTNQGNHHSRLRSSSWVGRQGDADFGIPYSLRALEAASGGSSGLVCEIRNVLGLMRRGERLRVEDVMILDQSVFSGVADFHDRHRDMRLDVDNMSYEELLALEERIGNVSTGLSEETISNLLKHKKYVVGNESQSDAEPCCICQEQYDNGEDMGTLDCGHDYHSNCIKRWLMHKNLCPICKTEGLAT